MAAKAEGADLVKQWDATLDGDTRPNHRQLDGQIRELEEPFEVGGYKPMHPGGFGKASEDCNCRCVSLKRARWALDEDELAELKKRAEYFGLDKSDEFAEFEKKYLKASEEEGATAQTAQAKNASPKAAETVDNSGKSGIMEPGKKSHGERDVVNQKTSSLKKAIGTYQQRIVEHQRKIDNPQNYVKDWDNLTPQHQEGLKKHWQKEIQNFTESIETRIHELRRRGEYHE